MRFVIEPMDSLIKKRGLQAGGMAQKFIDSECLKRMKPYTPRRNDILIKSAVLHTVIGSGKIKQETPYARYQYYGKLMVSPSTGSSYAKRYEEKVLTEKDLKYNGAPMRGRLWFERMKADHKEKILKGAAKQSGGRTG